MATLIMIGREGVGPKLCHQWESSCLIDAHRLLMDPKSEEDRGTHLVAHRYDQSILSCVAKSMGVSAIPDETFFAPTWSLSGAAFPIWTVRNRSGVRFSTNRAWFKFKKGVERSYLAARGLA